MVGFFKMFVGDPVSIALNLAIVVAFLVIMARIGKLKSDISHNESRLSALYDGKNVKRRMKKDVTMEIVTGTDVDPFDINTIRREYDEISARYGTVAQLVPIFPNLGIFGTVAGLMFQVNSRGIEEMTGSIALALSSTLLALLVTIFLKYYLAVSISAHLAAIEIRFRDYDRFRQDYVDKVKLGEGEEDA